MNDIDDTRAPLLDHLVELRRRLFYCILALIATFALAYYFADPIFAFLVRPFQTALEGGEGRLVYTKLYEAFFVQIKVALFTAFFISFPIISNQVWRFVAPGLYRREKAAFLPFILATPVLFTLGASLAYFFVMPAAFKFFLGFQKEEGEIALDALPAIGDYLSLVMHFILAFGIAFLLPVLLMLLERAGLVERQQLVKGRRYAIVAAFVIAAVITPPDVISQLMLAIPLMVLYELALVAMWFTARRRARVASQLPVPQP